MENRICIVLLTLMSALYSFADKKMAIRNIDTGESFEYSGLPSHTGSPA